MPSENNSLKFTIKTNLLTKTTLDTSSLALLSFNIRSTRFANWRVFSLESLFFADTIIHVRLFTAHR